MMKIFGQSVKEKHIQRQPHYFGGFVQILLILLALPPVLSTSAMATDTPIIGGSGGNYFRTTCAAGSYLVGLKGYTGKWIDRIAHICAPWLPVKQAFESALLHGQFLGTSPGGSFEQQTCRRDHAIVSWTFWNTVGDDNKRKFVSSIEGTCRRVIPPLATHGLQFGDPETQKRLGYGGWGLVAIHGRPDGKSECPAGELAIGFHGRAGLFLDALGLICGPAPTKAGYTPPSQAKNTPSALPTAPTINLPQGFIVKGKGVFKITPSRYMTGTHAHVQLTWLNPPPNLKSQSSYQYEAPMSLIAGPYGIDAPETYLARGTWEMRVRISRPKVSDWSQPVRFEYYLQNPAGTTKQKAPIELQRR
jgi:hypothetical protein